MYKTFKISALIFIAFTLSGCAAALLGTAAITSVSVASDRRTTGTLIDDESVELRITYEITSNNWLRNGSNVNAVSVNGVVLLLGQVAAQDIKNEIVKIAYEDERVVNVVNEIEVGEVSTWGERSKDVYITGKVKSALISNVNLNPTVINVTTERAKVYLMGLVNRAEAEQAALVASQVGGVRTVVKVFEYKD